MLIQQPRIYPHLSYLERIYSADLLVAYDNLKVSHKGTFEVRNRYFNQDAQEARFLNVPVEKHSHHRSAKILDLSFAEKHRSIIRDHYRRAPFFDKELLEYLVPDPESPSWILYFRKCLDRAMDVLSIRTRIDYASRVGSQNSKADRLKDILDFYGADEYLSGPGGQNYIKGQIRIPIEFRDQRAERDYWHTNSKTEKMLFYIDTLFSIGVEETRRKIRDAADWYHSRSRG